MIKHYRPKAKNKGFQERQFNKNFNDIIQAQALNLNNKKVELNS